MKIINMKSSADKVKGQGVGSAYIETVNLVKGLEDFKIKINSPVKSDITHYHTIDLKHYFNTFLKKSGVRLGYVHFLPETIDGSIKLPKPIRKIFDAYIIAFYKRMDYLVTVNPYFEERLAYYGIDTNKITSIPNFVSEKEFFGVNKQLKNMYKKQYKIDEDFVVLGVGQVQTRKGVLDFIECANQNPDKRFIWAGGFSFGSITDGYKSLKNVVENPPSNVTFLGIVDRSEMNKIYNMSDLLFMPSYNELFPMSILEAMSVGKPILLRDLDIYKVILDGYYIAGDNNSFSEIIDRMAHDEMYYEKAKKMSHAGSQYYSRDHIRHLWDDLYQKLASRRVS